MAASFLRIPIACLTATVLLAGCASGAPSEPKVPAAQDVLAAPPPLKSAAGIGRAALASMRKVTNVRVEATIDDNGELITSVMRITNGQQCRATLSWESVRAKVVVLPDHVYIHGSTAYWTKVGPEIPDWAVQKMSGRWIRFPQSEDFRDLCPWERFRRLFAKRSFGRHIVGRPNPDHPDGPAIRLVDSHDNISVTVEAEPPHRILTFSGNDGELHNRRDSFEARFSGFGNAAPITPPAGALDVTQLTP